MWKTIVFSWFFTGKWSTTGGFSLSLALHTSWTARTMRSCWCRHVPHVTQGEYVTQGGRIHGGARGNFRQSMCAYIQKLSMYIYIRIYVQCKNIFIYIKNYIDDSYSFKCVDICIYIYVCVLHERIKWSIYIYIDRSVCLSITRLWLIW